MGTTTTRTTTYEYAPVEPVVNVNKSVVVNTERSHVEVVPPVVQTNVGSMKTTKTTMYVEEPPLPTLNLNTGAGWNQSTTTKVKHAVEPVDSG